VRPLWIAFVLLALADLAALISGHDAWRWYTKPPLAVVLATIVAAASRGPDRARPVFILGLLFSALGDTALLGRSDAAFVTGTGCFALTHVCYIAAFVLAGDGPGLVRRRPWLGLPYAGAGLVATLLLWPHLGGLAYAVVLYSALLTAMALTALNLVGRIPQRGAILVAAGALFFMSSDTTLAFARFDPVLAPPQAPLLVMLTYLIAQALIVSGFASRPGRALPEAVAR
jgi:uncharacterized membrane protein YhhN